MGKLAKRSTQLELMDEEDLLPAELQDTLRGIERMNTLFGGNTCSLKALQEVTHGISQPSILDVGTGAGEIPRRFAQRCARRGQDVRIVGIDLAETSVAYAAARSVKFPSLSFRVENLFDVTESFDGVHCAAMLHHVGEDDAIVEALAHMRKVAKVAVVVNDLHRHPLAYYPIKYAAPFITRNRMVRNDAALSVWRSFTRAELLNLATRAGWPAPTVRWHPMFRWFLSTRN